MSMLRIVAKGIFKDSRGESVEVDLTTGMIGSAQDDILYAALLCLREAAHVKGLQAVGVRKISAILESGDDDPWPVSFIEYLEEHFKRSRER